MKSLKYTVNDYKSDIRNYGLEKTWNKILRAKLNNDAYYEDINVNNFGDLYEIGLAEVDKTKKKEAGKYYTPKDVASVMSKWLISLPGNNIADVGCGTGNLILSYLEIIGKKKAIELVKNGRIYLYDLDELALKIAQYSISILYGKELLGNINAIKCDFLDRTTTLPNDCKVISNPPYAKIVKKAKTWSKTIVIANTNELYAAFFEKIIKQSRASVIISPYSFCGAKKFYSLRRALNEHSGFIVSFDNVPANIFSGKKHGIFNTNQANSVRASITVTDDSEKEKGYRLTQLLRFTADERSKLLDNAVLEQFVGKEHQIVSDESQEYKKCPIELECLLKEWETCRTETIDSLIQTEPNEFKISIPTTCRYFCVGSKKDLARTGKHEIYAINQECFDYLYAFINSSFLYWQWRMLDGGINLTKYLLYSTPTFFQLANAEQKKKLHSLVEKAIASESDHLVYKKNASVLQESIKFPEKIRADFNDELVRILDANIKPPLFKILHSNHVFAMKGEA